MKIEVPKVIYAPLKFSGEIVPYHLYADYSPGTLNPVHYVWTISYVCGAEILIIRSDKSLSDVEREIFDFIRENKFEYD